MAIISYFSLSYFYFSFSFSFSTLSLTSHQRDHVMKAMDNTRPDDFIEISGSKMRKLAAQGAKPCDISNGKTIPSDLLAANCIPPGFMVQSGWEIV